jgi:hypothetical protein
MPLSSQATASPSIMQKRERRRASAARIRYTSQVPGRRFQAADGGDLPSLIAIGAARGNSVYRLIIQRGHSPDEIRRLAARAASARRRSANGNSLCGQNSAGFLQTCKAFKGIICDDISEFESYMPSHAVWSLPANVRTTLTRRAEPWIEQASRRLHRQPSAAVSLCRE